MRLRMVTPERLVLDTEVEEVYAPGVLGQFGVLPGHITFLTALTAGELRYRSGGRDHYVAISGGFAEVVREAPGAPFNDVVTVLADTAEVANEIDLDRARRAEQRAKDDLGRARDAIAPEAGDLQAALARATNRVAVASRSRA